MRPVLLIDFGSTYTKLTAVDLDVPQILGTSQAFTTAASDITRGYDQALSQLERQCGFFQYQSRLACSSAAGGLRMIACGLVPALTSKAAKLAAFGAGAKVIRSYAYGLTGDDLREIEDIKPDILLLSGGTDGGNSDVIIGNAHALSGVKGDFPIVVAGNRNAGERCREALLKSGHPVYMAPNVMPEMNRLNTAPVQQVLREVFLSRIIKAKGLDKANEILDGILMPTPSAVMEALTLLAQGTAKTRGLGELVAVDLGGATTDVYSIAKGDPTGSLVVVRGLQEPFVKRTVEGDIGMRYNAAGVLEAAGMEKLRALCDLTTDQVETAIRLFHEDPSAIPQTPEDRALDVALASCALGTALSRHAGTLERVYTPAGPIDQQTGKDLRGVNRMIVTGGALIYADNLPDIIKAALKGQERTVLTPRSVKLMADKRYILSAMGLLMGIDPETALCLMMEFFGKEDEYATVQ